MLLRNVEEHGVGDANLARELENVRELYRGMIVVYVVMGFAAACGLTAAGGRVPPGVGRAEAFVRVAVPALIAARAIITSSRPRVMRAAEMANTTGLRREALNLQRRGAARVDFGRFTTSIFTLFYYALSPLYGARTHLAIHAAATMNRALGDAKLELGWDADAWSLALWALRRSAAPVLAVAGRFSWSWTAAASARCRPVVPRGCDAEVA